MKMIPSSTFSRLSFSSSFARQFTYVHGLSRPLAEIRLHLPTPLSRRMMESVESRTQLYRRRAKRTNFSPTSSPPPPPPFPAENEGRRGRARGSSKMKCSNVAIKNPTSLECSLGHVAYKILVACSLCSFFAARDQLFRGFHRTPFGWSRQPPRVDLHTYVCRSRIPV